MCRRCLGRHSTRGDLGPWVQAEAVGAALHRRRSLGRFRVCPVAAPPGPQVLLALLRVLAGPSVPCRREEQRGAEKHSVGCSPLSPVGYGSPGCSWLRGCTWEGSTKVWEANKDFITWLIVLQHGNPGRNYPGHSLSLWFGLYKGLYKEDSSLSPAAASPCDSWWEDTGAGELLHSHRHGHMGGLAVLHGPGECSLLCRPRGQLQQLQEAPGSSRKDLGHGHVGGRRMVAGDDALVPAATTGATKGMWLGPLSAWGWPPGWPGGQDVAVPPPPCPCASAVQSPCGTAPCGTAPRAAALHSNPCASFRMHLQIARVGLEAGLGYATSV